MININGVIFLAMDLDSFVIPLCDDKPATITAAKRALEAACQKEGKDVKGSNDLSRSVVSRETATMA